MKRSLAVGIVIVGIAAGCGGSNNSPSTDAPASNAQPNAAAATPEQMAAQIQDAMKGAAASQAKAVEFEQLTALIPDLAGWEKSGVKGEQGAIMGMSYSKAEGRYQKGDVSIHLEITDTAMIQMMVMPFQMIANGGFDTRSSEGYKRGTTIAGHPGWEEWENEPKNGEVNLLVGNRFIVKAEGNDLPNIDAVKQVVQAVNLSKLAGLK